jgi:hypothetical protein
VNLTGPVTDAAGIAEVAVSIDGGPWLAASVDGGAWRHAWLLGGMEDGVAHVVAARATDVGGHTTQATRTVTVDIQPPAPVTVTVTYTDSQGVLAELRPGQTVRDVLNPALRVTWTESAGAAGQAGYLVGMVDARGGVTQTARDAAWPREVALQAAEAHAYLIRVAAVDARGNQAWTAFGPLYADTPRTPDYAPLHPPTDDGGAGWPTGAVYDGWLDSGCSEVGVDRVTAELAGATAARRREQRLHVTWDADALRLRWSGADWNADGHLLIFLNTQPGQGTLQAHNPLTANRTVTVTVRLPVSVNYVVWVSDARAARLLRWDGAAWAAEGDIALRAGESGADVALPFVRLGIADPAAAELGLIAFAIERTGAMQVWSAMPPANPRNSLALVNPGGTPLADHQLALWQAYHWDSLGLGQCPNGDMNPGQYADADLRAWLEAQPAGSVTETRLGALYWAWPVEQGGSRPVLGDGQIITYTFAVSNAGRAAAPGAALLITAEGGVALPGGQRIANADRPDAYTQTVALGDIAPGARLAAAVTAVVDTRAARERYAACVQSHPAEQEACQVYLDAMRRARVTARLVDQRQAGEAVEALAAEHTLDAEAPTHVAIEAPADQRDNPPAAMSGAGSPAVPDSQPPIYAQPGAVTLQGTAIDASGVPWARVEVLDPRGDVADSECANPTPHNGRWACAVSLAGARTGERYFARVMVTDTFGQASGWSAWRVLIADAQPPQVSLGVDSRRVLSDVVFGPAMPVIMGTLADNAIARGMEVCAGAASPRLPYVLYLPFLMAAGAPAARVAPAGPAALGSWVRCEAAVVEPGNAASGEWSYQLPQPGAVDGVTRTVWLHGTDAAGNRSAGERATYRVDTVAPRLAVTEAVTRVSLTAYQAAPFPLLRGTASDGGGVPSVSLRVLAPGGAQIAALTVTDGAWQHMPEAAELAKGNYDLMVTASDAAGNTAWGGVFTLVVED